jgi:hypothetical protein
MAEAVAFIHKGGCAHRDFKPKVCNIRAHIAYALEKLTALKERLD